MIWLWANAWWVGTLAIVALAVLHPAGALLLRKVPLKVWLALAGIALLGLSFQAGRWHERRAHRSAQEAAEVRADAKAAVVAKQAQERAGKATAKIRARTNEVADEVSRQMDGVRVCPDPVQPPSVRDAGEQAVERARRALSPD